MKAALPTLGHDSERRIDPAQAPFWDALGGRPLDAADVVPFGIEYVTDPQRLGEVRRCYPCPTVVDAGFGAFGAPVGLLFIDDDTGRAVAYGAPVVVMRAALEDRAATIGVLRDGLAMIEAIAADQCDDAVATVRRIQDAAAETLRRARLTGLTASAPSPQTEKAAAS